jgi:hypothetical protein
MYNGATHHTLEEETQAQQYPQNSFNHLMMNNDGQNVVDSVVFK